MANPWFVHWAFTKVFLGKLHQSFPRCEAHAYYDFGDAEDNEWLVDEIITHQWKGAKVFFLVQWNLGDATWEPYSECKDLMGIDRYLELLGIEGKDWHKLPRKTLVKAW